MGLPHSSMEASNYCYSQYSFGKLDLLMLNQYIFCFKHDDPRNSNDWDLMSKETWDVTHIEKLFFLWKNHRKNKETQITTVERIIHNTITRVSHLLMGLSHSSTEVSIYLTHRSIPKNVIFFHILKTDCRKPRIN